MADLRALFNRMSLSGKSAVELLVPNTAQNDPNDDFKLYLQIHQYSGNKSNPSTQGKLAVLCSSSNIRIFNAERLVRESTIEGSSSQVTKVQFSNSSPDLVYSSSLDSHIRCWDLRTDLLKPCSTYAATDSRNCPFLTFDLTYNDNFICAGTELKGEDSLLHIWDCRKAEPVSCFEDFHSDNIIQLKFHPNKQDSLLTASLDGLANLVDISQAEEDAVQNTFNAVVELDMISWLNDNDAFISTNSEEAFIWDCTKADTKLSRKMEDFQAVTSSGGQVDRLVDCFLNGHSSPILLATNERGDGQLYTLEDSSVHLGTLSAAHTDCIKACTYNAKSQTLYTVGADVLLCCWKPSDQIPCSPPKASSSKIGHKRKADKKPYKRN